MKKVDLCRHQCGVLELTRGAVFVPFERVFCMEIIEGQDEEKKHEQEGDIELFSIYLRHRIPCGSTINELEGGCQMILIFIPMSSRFIYEETGLFRTGS
jgi:hypothetical protein